MSVMTLLADAAGKQVTPASVAEAQAHLAKKRAEAQEAWQAAFALAISMGALTQGEVDEQADKLARRKDATEDMVALLMREQLDELQRCRVGEMLRAETRVCLRGLQAKPALNGACGRVQSFVLTKGRYVIALDAGGEQITVRAANLEEATFPQYDEL